MGRKRTKKPSAGNAKFLSTSADIEIRKPVRTYSRSTRAASTSQATTTSSSSSLSPAEIAVETVSDDPKPTLIDKDLQATKTPESNDTASSAHPVANYRYPISQTIIPSPAPILTTVIHKTFSINSEAPIARPIQTIQTMKERGALPIQPVAPPANNSKFKVVSYSRKSKMKDSASAAAPKRKKQTKQKISLNPFMNPPQEIQSETLKRSSRTYGSSKKAKSGEEK